MKIQWPREFPGIHWLDAREEKAVLDVIRGKSPFRYYGVRKPKYVDALEARARRFYGAQYALAVNSGTGALMTAMQALGIGPGMEVILPCFFWTATVSAAVQANAIPVLCEVNDSFTMDPEDLQKKITPRTRLIVPVHMAGAVCDMQAVMRIARRHRIPVFEDCAQANGGEFQSRKIGTFGKLGMFSLQMNKNATAGEGGLLITNDSKLYTRCVSAHDVGLPWIGGAPCFAGPESMTWGGGRRMSELTGAVASVQIQKLPRILNRMRASKRRIKAALAGTPGLSFRRLNDEAGDTGCFLILLLETPAAARLAAGRLQAQGIASACRLADYGLHIYSNIPQLVNRTPLSPAGNPWNLPQNRALVRDYQKGACPQSDALFARSISIPIPSCLTREEEKMAAQIIQQAVPD
ncbi:MAG: DegT/DnrJ/EryC1/StrS family aminotransferase [bacterium]